MTKDKFQDRYRIASARVSWHEYNGGMYFVTICTAARVHSFGEIVAGAMQLSGIGKIANDCFTQASVHYPYAEIPLFAIMPNHIHAIVIIDSNDVDCRDAINRVSTTTPPTTSISRNPMISQTLGTVVRGIKARITRMAHKNNLPFAWQPRFHDHIMRNVAEMNHIAEYIENNVAQWDLDELNDNY